VSEKPYSICAGCREKIDPEAPDTVEAVELISTPTMGQPNDVREGLKAYFHEACFPGTSRYRRLN
jgi:hypothetical protein